MEFKLNTDYIELIKLLKLLRLAASGGEAKKMVEAGLVQVNGITEYRKRAKLKRGDSIRTGNREILIQ